MRFLIPMAGNSETHFPQSEFHFPKPLIEVDGTPMIQRVIENLSRAKLEAEFICIVRREDCVEFSLDATIGLATAGRCEVIQLTRPTAGAACSALLAIEHIDDDKPLVVCNGDQVFDCDLASIIADFERRDLDAGVITFPSLHPRWSYARVDADGCIIEAAEKRVISRRAIAGFYYFKRGRDFVRAAQASVRNDRSVGGLYFVAPTLNEIILEGARVGFFDISESDYHSFYSPQRIEQFARGNQSRSIAGAVALAHPVGKRVNVVIPMAGLGSRFSSAGYVKPKPFIDVAGATMIERVMENLAIEGGRYVLLARREHLETEASIAESLSDRGDVEFVCVDKVTEGAACTVLLARSVLNLDEPLLVANCDQIIDFDCAAFVADCERRQLDGSILVFRDRDRDPKWSFARVAPSGLVTETREKQPISDLATVGLYYFRKARDFVDGAIDMIARNERVNSEFYVCPVYNHVIASGRRIGVFEIDAEAMHGIGTPDDLKAFLRLRYKL